ncbi:tetratricopeptide repeat-containing protein [Sphingomonas sp. 22R3R2A-7]|uniref:tetratricopeptide repeat-containing protein n=1 Tax=Sphingomonas sp. 22R3R2A-7 TaxID=3050230 RepID=UPI002FE394DE
MSIDTRKLCFVVMGFGKKTDFESGRTLDLDATYEAIVEPSASALDLRCIRADEIMHSGVIDTAMYEMLLRADLVIADISTGNVNAVYELGVRHALRPNSTIIMMESEGSLHFDLNHVATFKYEHMGQDIGSREAARAQRELTALIREVMVAERPDSPVYTFLPALQQPKLTEEEFAELVDETEAAQEQLSGYLNAGEAAGKADRYEIAAGEFAKAAEMKPDDPYIVQQLALWTYKSALPSALDALMTGLRLIEPLRPDRSNDPETLGIAGAMRKRLWLLTSDRVQLDTAIRYYGRGFEVRRDYYNGENLATCYDYRAEEQTEPAEAQFDRMSAQKVRGMIVEILTEVRAAANFDQRSDRHWVLATLANCSYGLGQEAAGDEFEAAFFGEDPADWERQTYLGGKTAAQAAAARLGQPGAKSVENIGSRKA